MASELSMDKCVRAVGLYGLISTAAWERYHRPNFPYLHGGWRHRSSTLEVPVAPLQKKTLSLAKQHRYQRDFARFLAGN
jgi:hypothetical protein